MSIRALGKQSLVYGVGTILTRLVTFLLLPFYTNVFSAGEYGTISLAYAFIGFAIIIYRYGMDAALIKFYVIAEGDEKKKYFSTIFISQMITSLLISGILYLSSATLAPALLGGEYKTLMQLVSVILFFDALWMLPMIVLRAEEKPKQYIILSLINVILLMSLNIYLVAFKDMGVRGVLIGNILASGVLLLATLPKILSNLKLKYLDTKILKNVLKFGLPFFPAGIFNIILELSDRYLLEWLTNTEYVGIYSAGNKLGMFGLLLVLGFNMGWTPYFLKMGEDKSAKETFSNITTYFTGISGWLIVLVSLWIENIVKMEIGSNTFFGSEFWASAGIVPIILLGYYFSGLFILQLPGIFIKNKTGYMPLIRGLGAIISVILNLLLIPIYNIYGAAFAKMTAFLCMAITIGLINRKIFPIYYNWIGIIYPVIILAIIIFIPVGIFVKLFISIIYPLFWYFVVINEQEKNRIRGFLKL